jgi:hypothetical protein
LKFNPEGQWEAAIIEGHTWGLTVMLFDTYVSEICPDSIFTDCKSSSWLLQNVRNQPTVS